MVDETKTVKDAAKKTAVKKASTKKTAVKKASTKKTAVKKASTKKAAVKKVAASKSAVKKVAVKKDTTRVEAGTVAEKSTPRATAPKSDSAVKKLCVTLVRSKNGRLASHRACVSGLGLRRMHQTVQVIDTPENRGMINKVRYMLNVEEV